MPDPMFELRWLCMRRALHEGECLTAGCPYGVDPPNRCHRAGARMLAPEEIEAAPADLYVPPMRKAFEARRTDAP